MSKQNRRLSSNIFTVGGTLSANAHGRDIDVTQFVEVVESFHLLLADGRVVSVSRRENPELFSLVVGGYGMYGVILDVTLHVTRDELYEQRAVSLDYTQFPAYFAHHIKADSSVVLMLARPSIDPHPASFLRELVVVTWRRAHASCRATIRCGHRSRRWELLNYRSPRNTDIIQEYYVPVENFVPFMDRFRDILVTGKMNVLRSTVRYVSPNATPALAYVPRRPAFAIIQMSNVGLDRASQDHTASVTRQLVDAAIEKGGTYYLTYQLYPTAEQLSRAYPRAREAFERKRFYDPDETFSNQFYDLYGRNRAR